MITEAQLRLSQDLKSIIIFMMIVAKDADLTIADTLDMALLDCRTLEHQYKEQEGR